MPQNFLVWATIANSCKQISMLTSSSTRTALCNSFHDGQRENIGDITAKGEAQIANVDLIGTTTGVTFTIARIVVSCICYYNQWKFIVCIGPSVRYNIMY
jgi:hypothetical protein